MFRKLNNLSRTAITVILEWQIYELQYEKNDNYAPTLSLCEDHVIMKVTSTEY